MGKQVKSEPSGVFSLTFYRRIVAISGVARRWEVIYILVGPFLFAGGILMHYSSIPLLLQGYIFVWLVPYVGVGFIILDSIRRRYVGEQLQKRKRLAKERDDARQMIEAARVAKRDQKEAAERARQSELDQQGQRDRLNTLGRAKSSASRDEETNAAKPPPLP